MKKILVETSARHIHLCEDDVRKLFGADHTLTKKKDLSQPGEFACEERVDVVGPKGTLKNVVILGPARKATQVELSLTDARTVGITTPIRLSGDVEGTPGCTLIGTVGSVELTKGVLAAKRHVHMTPEAAAEFGVEDKQNICVKVATADRTTIFGDVIVRVHKNFGVAMHIDTDESNAAAMGAFGEGEIIRSCKE